MYCGTRAADAQVSPMPVDKVLSHHPFRSFPDFFFLDRREFSTLEKPWKYLKEGKATGGLLNNSSLYSASLDLSRHCDLIGERRGSLSNPFAPSAPRSNHSALPRPELLQESATATKLCY